MPAAPNSAAWSTTSAVAISSASCCSESGDVNEYAFALGALSHYAADIAGHPAVNQAVAIEYPKPWEEFGKSVRYAQEKTVHLKTEFGFDTLQVARNRYTPPRSTTISSGSRFQSPCWSGSFQSCTA